MARETQKLLHTFAALADLGQWIADTNDFEELVRYTLHMVIGTLGIRRGALAEYDHKAAHLRLVALRGLSEDLPTTIPCDGEDAEALSLEGAGGYLVRRREGTSTSPQKLKEPLVKLLERLRIELVMPLVVRGELVGAILLGSKATGKPFTIDDREIVRAMARHIAVGIYNHRLLAEVEQRAEENHRLYEELRAIYHDTVRAFAAAIDYKDKYTQGHSERVGKYSAIIAREMGWSEEQVEGMAIAGYLHDIGKLVVDRNIINAPYKINAKESADLNRHPAAGYEILKPISHPYADIPLMARYHHERVDGGGYPEGLKGDQIPIGAKIVTLADSFDAMTTNRPYKQRRPLEDALEDVWRNAGKQFASEVVTPFFHAFLKEVSGETKDRQIIALLGEDYVKPARIKSLLVQLITDLESDAHAVASA